MKTIIAILMAIGILFMASTVSADYTIQLCKVLQVKAEDVSGVESVEIRLYRTISETIKPRYLDATIMKTGLAVALTAASLGLLVEAEIDCGVGSYPILSINLLVEDDPI